MVSQRLDVSSPGVTALEVAPPLRSGRCPGCIEEVWEQLGITNLSEANLYALDALRLGLDYCQRHQRLLAARQALEDMVRPTVPLLRRVRINPPLAVVESMVVAPPEEPPAAGTGLVQVSLPETPPEEARLDKIAQTQTVPLVPRAFEALPAAATPIPTDEAVIKGRLWGALPETQAALAEDALLRAQLREGDRQVFPREAASKETAPLGDVQAHERMRVQLAARMADLRAELARLYVEQRALEGRAETPPAT